MPNDKALIVEDDPDQAALTANLVRSIGLTPILAESAAKGLVAARKHRPAVVLLDVLLPDADGFEVCRRLRAQKSTMALPIVMLTALDSDLYRRRGFRVGANQYVVKPFDAQRLVDAVDAARAWRKKLRHDRIRAEILVELQSELTFLQEVNDFLAELYHETPLNPRQIANLKQAVMEMGQNAIEWGHRHRVEELVRITYRVRRDRIEIVVRDQGPGFDPADLPHAAANNDPLTHLDLREKLGLREGGFGLMISRGMVDELRHNEAGNEVTLVKRFETAEIGRASDTRAR
ncbi:MAG: hypothetical protein NVSMB14_05340 [Isosphaeraceae bacterium]